MDKDGFRLSVVVPLFNEEQAFPPFLAELKRHTGGYGDVEIILVDDGSTDSTPGLVMQAASDDPRIKFIRFSRNFGHQLALLAGLEYATGDCVVMMDGDLQHPPELIHEMIARWQDGCHIVNTVRTGGEGCGLFKRASASVFYFLLNRAASIPVTPNAADFRLIDKAVLGAVLLHREKNPYLRGIIESVGFKKTTLEFFAPARVGGKTKYSLGKMAKLALDGMYSFSGFPMRFFLAAGSVLLAFDILYTAYVLYLWLAGGEVVSGWSSLAILITLLTGMSIVSFGVLGGYISRMFDEVRDRPRYILLDTNATRPGRGKGPGTVNDRTGTPGPKPG